MGINAIDFFSFGHLIIGYFNSLAFNSIFYAIFGYSLILFCLCCNLFVGIVWELFENVVLFKINLKFARRRDSLINSLSDVLFFTIGGLIASFIIFLHLGLFLVITITIAYGIPIIMRLWALKIFKRKTLE